MEIIDSGNEYLSIYKYKHDDIKIVDIIREMLGKEEKPFVMIIDDSMSLYSARIRELNLYKYIAFEMVELTYTDATGKFLGIEECPVEARELGKVERLQAIFPPRIKQINEAAKPYIPMLCCYATKFLKATISHIPQNLHYLNFGFLYLLQIIAYIKDVGVDRKQAAVNDQSYGIRHNITKATKPQVATSCEYIARILQDAGIRTEFYESFAYWSKEILKRAKVDQRVKTNNGISVRY
jgi:hypothetical protein